jgi:hypothetical protein
MLIFDVVVVVTEPIILGLVLLVLWDVAFSP